MSAVCPVGHASEADDYCDTCGAPMTGPASMAAGAVPSPPSRQPARQQPAPAPQMPATASPPSARVADDEADIHEDSATADDVRSCPHCGAPASAAHLFCESCGYDFTTGALPRPLAEKLASLDPRVAARPRATAGAPDVPVGAADDPAGAADDRVGGRDDLAGAPDEPVGVPLSPKLQTDSADGAASEPDGAGPEGEPEGEVPRSRREVEPPPREPLTSEDTKTEDTKTEDTGAEGPHESERDAPTAAKPTASVAVPAPASPAAPRDVSSDSIATRAPSRQAKGDWVVEVWVDPGWFAAQETGEECPSPGVPDVVRLRGRGLIGRYSASRRVVPEVDCGADSGVSRRHAEFTTDGTRWWIEDLGSSNGTFVGPASGPLPQQPIAAGQRVEVSDDDRIYVGAWTRLVVRKATAGDLAGTG